MTLIGGNAASSSSPICSIRVIRVDSPLGSTTTSSPGAHHAAGDLAGVAAVVRELGGLGRITRWTGNRTSIRLRSLAMCTVSR